MIKFILAVIAMIFVGLAAYVYMNPKETHAPIAKVAQKTEARIVEKETPSVPKKSVSARKKTIPSRNIFPDINVNEKYLDLDKISKNIEIESEETRIGENLTLEKINSMSIDAKKKEELMRDFAFFEGSYLKDKSLMSDETASDLISKDVDNGILP